MEFQLLIKYSLSFIQEPKSELIRVLFFILCFIILILILSPFKRLLFILSFNLLLITPCQLVDQDFSKLYNLFYLNHL